MLAGWLRADPELPSDCEAVGVDLRTIAEGDQGVYETANFMVAIIRQGMAHPVVRDHAVRAVTGLDHRSETGLLDAIERYARRLVRYLPDPFNVEWLQTPWYVLGCQVESGEQPRLDCDDMTMLTLSLAGTIGLPCVVRVAATNDDGVYDHVLGLVQADGVWRAVDLTGMPPWRITRYEDFPVT
jgi:hypothetical protein